MTSDFSRTIEYYNLNALSFAGATVGVSMREALLQFASLLPEGGLVLDWGCGSGRDSLALRELGFSVVSTDASSEMCVQALKLTGTIVRLESFDELDECSVYDGIWACSSLLHIPYDHLPSVFDKAWHALKNGGVLYCSFKYGKSSGFRRGRWFTDLDEDLLKSLIVPHFSPLRIWMSKDVRPERSEITWLNCLAVKPRMS